MSLIFKIIPNYIGSYLVHDLFPILCYADNLVCNVKHIILCQLNTNVAFISCDSSTEQLNDFPRMVNYFRTASNRAGIPQAFI
jgi:hypothetical protein